MLTTQAELAREIDRHRSTVARAIKAHSIPTVDGKVDREVFLALWNARVDRAQQRRSLGRRRENREQPPAGDGVTPSTSRDRRESAEARLAEIRVQELESQLVRRDEVERAARAMASAVVQHMAAIPDRIAAEFGTDDDRRRNLRVRLQEEMTRVRTLVAAADPLERQALDPDGLFSA